MQNLTIFQFFHWYFPPEGKLWRLAGEKASHLKKMGVTHVWLPPAYKSSGGLDDPGYAVYDLYDLGEFDQKGTIRTRYGTKDEYLACIHTLHENGMQVFADIVFNHMFGADKKEKIKVQKVRSDNRNEKEGEPFEMDAWTKFTFPGRKNKYSDFIWDWHSFTGLSENGHDVFLILNEYTENGWENMLENELGNYDYLMGTDIEFRNPHVRDEIKKWGVWYTEFTGVDCFRLDAVKHIHFSFINEWIDHLRHHFKKDIWFIGEYWRNSPDALEKFTEATEGRLQLFDVPLHFNFQQASEKKADYDLRQIFDNSLLQRKPELSVTFVDNHDTQPLQSLQSSVDYWFQPLAYSIILLRKEGIPCVFYPHVYEAKYWDRVNDSDVYVELNCLHCVQVMIKVRNHLAYGEQRDYFDHPNTVGWTREGVDEKPFSGCAVLINNSEPGHKSMELGKKHAGKIFIDICGGRSEKITINEEGWGDFLVNGASFSVWVCEESLSLINQ